LSRSGHAGASHGAAIRQILLLLALCGAGVRIGRLQKLCDSDLSTPLVRAKLREHYGASLPQEEAVISPSEMFDSPELELVGQF
jgi:hypothetical protein